MGSSPRSRSNSASSTATPVFPTPVGPKIAITEAASDGVSALPRTACTFSLAASPVSRPLLAKKKRKGECRDPPQRLRSRGFDLHRHEFTRAGDPVEVDRLPVPGPPPQPRLVGAARPFDPAVPGAPGETLGPPARP